MQGHGDLAACEGLPHKLIIMRPNRLTGSRGTNSDIVHLGMHSLGISQISRVDPFFGGLLDFVRNFPLCFIGFASGCDMLNVSHNDVYDKYFTSIIF